MIKTLKIRDAAQMDRIACLASDAPYKIFLRSGRTTLNARILPLMRMYTLVGRKVAVVAEDSADPIHFGFLVDEMARTPA